MTVTTLRIRLHDALRRHRWAALVAAAILVGLIAAWLSRGEFKGRHAVPRVGEPVAAVAPPPSPAPAPVVRPAPPPVVAAPAPEEAAVEDPDDSDRMAHAIEKAARKALDRGEPVRWHKAGARGYVVVSEMRELGDRSCRNVSATIDRDDGPTQSSSHLWCMTPDGDWAPAE